jgi:thiol-disulfide isomerase/thioredoxin
MRTAIGVTLLCSMVLLACGTKEMPGISGRVIGEDGKPPVLAHVHLLGTGDRVAAAVTSVKVGDDGTFTIAIPHDRYYDLIVTAVNHQPVRIPLALDDVPNLAGVEIHLAPYAYLDSITEPKIVGDWNDFIAYKAEPMVPEDDGTFVYERKVDADTLAYQLVGVVKGGRSINGTDSDYFVYDGGGDYISVVSVPDRTARVVFDPQKARMVKAEGLPRVDFGPKGRQLAEMFEISARLDAESDKMMAAFQRYAREHGTYEGFEYDLSNIKAYLLGKMSEDHGSPVSRYAAVKFASMGEMGLESPLTEDDARAISEVLPVADRMWTAAPMGLLYVYGQAARREEMPGLFGKEIADVVDRGPRTVMLLEIGMAAKETGDTTRVRAIYEDLTQNYADVDLPYVQFRIKNELDPDLAISIGKSLPDFEIALMDEPRVVSKTTFLGRYYMLDFWATWCGPCIGEMGNLHKAYERFGGPDFEILSISFDENPEDVRQFRASKWKMPWLHAYLADNFQSEMAKTFEISGIPRPILVGPDGVILATGMALRGDRLEETLARFVEKKEPL